MEESQPGLAGRFVKEVFGFDFSSDRCAVNTQVEYPQGKVDMQWGAGERSLILENKLDSTLEMEKDNMGANQLQRYLHIQNAKTGSHKVAVVTRDPDPLEVRYKIPPETSGGFLGYFRWYHIYHWLRHWHSTDSLKMKDPVAVFLANQFLEFMEVEELGPPRALSVETVNTIEAYRARKNELGNWIREVYSRLERKYDLPLRMVRGQQDERHVGETYAYEWIETNTVRMYLSLYYQSRAAYGVALEIEDSPSKDYRNLSNSNVAKLQRLGYKWNQADKTHYVEFSFDDGFLAESYDDQLDRATSWFDEELGRLASTGLVSKKRES